MNFELFTACFAVVGMLCAEVYYLRDTFHGKTKPHLFSWIIWAILMAISAVVQWAEGSTIAATATGVGGFLSLLVCVLAYRRGEKHIAASDWICFVSALCAIPVWLMTRDPLYAAIMITLIDALGYFPTYRKSWSAPREENLSMYALSATTDMMICLSLAPFSLVAVLYPASGLFTNGGLVIMLLLRRHALATQQPPRKRRRHAAPRRRKAALVLTH